jgi:hypothetical protein
MDGLTTKMEIMSRISVAVAISRNCRCSALLLRNRKKRVGGSEQREATTTTNQPRDLSDIPLPASGEILQRCSFLFYFDPIYLFSFTGTRPNKWFVAGYKQLEVLTNHRPLGSALR